METNQFRYLLRALIEAYRVVYPTGGLLHAVLEDGNIGKKDIGTCLEQENLDLFGRTIGEGLLQLSVLDRFEVVFDFQMDDKIAVFYPEIQELLVTEGENHERSEE